MGNPENNFTWSLGKRASLVLEVPRPRNPVLLEAEIAPSRDKRILGLAFRSLQLTEL